MNNFNDVIINGDLKIKNEFSPLNVFGNLSGTTDKSVCLSERKGDLHTPVYIDNTGKVQPCSNITIPVINYSYSTEQDSLCWGMRLNSFTFYADISGNADGSITINSCNCASNMPGRIQTYNDSDYQYTGNNAIMAFNELIGISNGIKLKQIHRLASDVIITISSMASGNDVIIVNSFSTDRITGVRKRLTLNNTTGRDITLSFYNGYGATRYMELYGENVSIAPGNSKNIIHYRNRSLIYNVFLSWTDKTVFVSEHI